MIPPKTSANLGLPLLLLLSVGVFATPTLLAHEGGHPHAVVSVGAAVTRFLENRLKEDPDDIVAWNRLGNIYLERAKSEGNSELLVKASHAASESLRSVPAPQNFGGLALQTRVAHENHQFFQAATDARRLCEAFPKRADAWRILGSALFELGGYPEAEAAWTQMKTMEPDSFETKVCEFRSFRFRGKFPEAREAMEAAALKAAQVGESAKPTVAWCYVQLGVLSFEQGDFQQATKHYKQALELDPDSVVALEHQAELEAAKGNYDAAFASFQRLAARIPKPTYFQAMGDIAILSKHPENATLYHTKALAIYRKESEAGNAHYYHHLAAHSTDSTRNLDEALFWAAKDLTIRQSVSAWETMAWALWRAGRYPEALESVKKALAPGAQEALLLYRAGLIYMSAGSPDEGKYLLDQARQLNPNFSAFRNLL